VPAAQIASMLGDSEEMVAVSMANFTPQLLRKRANALRLEARNWSAEKLPCPASTAPGVFGRLFARYLAALRHFRAGDSLGKG
jgi:hypothetical protein